MAAPETTARSLLALYRRILRLHRHRLPPPMRALGDDYLRDEWRRTRVAATTPAQWRTFADEWRKYAGMLAGQADIPGGSGDIPDAMLGHMSPEQKARLRVLEQEARGALERMEAELRKGPGE